MIARMPAWPVPLLAAATAVCGALAILSAPWGLGSALDEPGLQAADHAADHRLRLAARHRPPLTRRWVLIGLGLSLCGDVALLWPDHGFLPGLVSFLLAHLAYLRAFTRDGVRLAARRAPFVFYGALAGLILWQLWPGVPPGLRASGAGLCGLSGLDGRAGGGGRSAVDGARRGSGGGLWLALGGALFLCSDALLATNRFAGAAATVGLVDPAQLLAGAVVHRLLAGGPARLDPCASDQHAGAHHQDQHRGRGAEHQAQHGAAHGAARPAAGPPGPAWGCPCPAPRPARATTGGCRRVFAGWWRGRSWRWVRSGCEMRGKKRAAHEPSSTQR